MALPITTQHRPAAAGRHPVAPTPSMAPRRLRMAELLSALSHALDLTEGQPLGHSVRACAVAMRIADTLGLDEATRSALYYAALLKDAGCSSNASRMSALFGSDDRLVKQRMKLVDFHAPLTLALNTLRNSGVGSGIRERMRHFVGIARSEGTTRDIIAIRCERGADIALRLGFPQATADAIRALDEHWNGRGQPLGLAGDDIPLLARIASIAQTVEVFLAQRGVRDAMRMVRARRGAWFDPRLADVVLAWANDDAWWASLPTAGANEAVSRLGVTEDERVLDPLALDTVAQAFADIIDAKSPFTYSHSSNVSRYASEIGARMGLRASAVHRLRRAGLLHDIGKVGVSNRILDKAGPLTDGERVEVERHPRHTWEILNRVDAFRDFAWMAAVHHEKLDGTGYPWGLKASQLDPLDRVLAVADVYEALTADRPYRGALSPSEALAIIARDRGTRLCADAIDGLASYVAEQVERSAEGDATDDAL